MKITQDRIIEVSDIVQDLRYQSKLHCLDVDLELLSKAADIIEYLSNKLEVSESFVNESSDTSL